MTLDPEPARRPQVVLRQEHLQVTTVRQPNERLLVRRVLVTETRQIEVTVRREELRLEPVPATDQPVATTATTTATTTRRTP